MSNGLNSQMKKFLNNREIKRIGWLIVLIVSLSALYFVLKSDNEHTYCFAKIENNWYYGKKFETIRWWNDVVSTDVPVPVCDLLGCQDDPYYVSNYIPTTEEWIENMNKNFLYCYKGDWKNNESIV